MRKRHPSTDSAKALLYICLPPGANLEWLYAFAQPGLLDFDCTTRGVHKNVSWSQRHHLAVDNHDGSRKDKL